MKRDYKNHYPLAKGKTRFVVKYEGFGITFSTEIDEVDVTCAKTYFEKMYPSANFVSITEKQ